MELILWRHAEAEDATHFVRDEERKLTSKGEKQAQRMAAWLRPRLPKKIEILVSPAIRTLMTLKALDMQAQISREVGLSADFTSLLTAVSWPNMDGAFLVIGHQPTLGRTAAFLLTGTQEDWVVKKGGLVWLQQTSHDPRPALKAFISADMV